MLKRKQKKPNEIYLVKSIKSYIYHLAIDDNLDAYGEYYQQGIDTEKIVLVHIEGCKHLKNAIKHKIVWAGTYDEARIIAEKIQGKVVIYPC